MPDLSAFAPLGVLGVLVILAAAILWPILMNHRR